MSRSARLVPVALMGSLAVAYVAARERIAARVPYLAIIEFPIGALIFGMLLWAALSRRRPAPPVPWRRHQQIVRPLPDPAIALDLGTLERWLQTGQAPEAAADVVARSVTTDAATSDTLRGEIEQEMSSLASRRKRESYLKKQLRQGA